MRFASEKLERDLAGAAVVKDATHGDGFAVRADGEVTRGQDGGHGNSLFMSAKVAAVDFPPMVNFAPDSKLLLRIVTMRRQQMHSRATGVAKPTGARASCVTVNPNSVSADQRSPLSWRKARAASTRNRSRSGM
jgi:hypothetical protein